MSEAAHVRTANQQTYAGSSQSWTIRWGCRMGLPWGRCGKGEQIRAGEAQLTSKEVRVAIRLGWGQAPPETDRHLRGGPWPRGWGVCVNKASSGEHWMLNRSAAPLLKCHFQYSNKCTCSLCTKAEEPADHPLLAVHLSRAVSWSHWSLWFRMNLITYFPTPGGWILLKSQTKINRSCGKNFAR